MRLANLQAKFLRLTEGGQYTDDGSFEDCDGIEFQCPRCLDEKVTCWKPHVSRDVVPTQARWIQTGRGLSDLVLLAAAGSAMLTGTCGWHGWVGRNGVPPGEAR